MCEAFRQFVHFLSLAPEREASASSFQGFPSLPSLSLCVANSIAPLSNSSISFSVLPPFHYFPNSIPAREKERERGWFSNFRQNLRIFPLGKFAQSRLFCKSFSQILTGREFSISGLSPEAKKLAVVVERRFDRLFVRHASLCSGVEGHSKHRLAMLPERHHAVPHRYRASSFVFCYWQTQGWWIHIFGLSYSTPICIAYPLFEERIGEEG